MAVAIDALTSPTLKHLREAWWDDEFTEFLAETLKPRAGNRILDVGCGEGLAEVAIGRLHISQVRLFGVDLVFSKVFAASQETASHNLRVKFAAADACRLPFRDGVFDSLYSVAVLQHVSDVESAVAEFARVTAPRGRVLAVEPDNSARYGFSSTPAGRRAFELSRTFFNALSGQRTAAAAIGPNLPRLFSERGLEPIEVRLFPVSQTVLGPPDAAVWASRSAGRRAGARIGRLPMLLDGSAATTSTTLTAYEAEANHAGSSFVEIQNTILFATVGQKID